MSGQEYDNTELMQALGSLAPVFDTTSNGVVIIDREGVVVVYNRASASMLGPHNCSPVGRHHSEVHPDAWPDIKKLLKNGQPQIGRKIKFPTATIIANRSPVILRGQVVGVISIFQDISAYESMISELQGYRELHRELAAIIESSYDGLYIADGQAVTMRVNRAYERITGLRREDLVGRTMQQLVKEHVFDHSVTLDVLRKGVGATIMQNIKGGKQVMVTGTPIFDEQGAIARVVTNVRDITELNRLRAELAQSRQLSTRYYQTLIEQQQYEHALQDMVAKSRSMARAVQMAVKAAAAETLVLLTGESGVGKSMLARIIHKMSPRAERPFVKINCGAIPESLMESELFGYRRGAFTGAAPKGKAGLIEAGHKGTIFLDEVGELTLAMQVKLLQVIEEKTFIPVGGAGATEVDTRIIAATNRDLKALAASGDFREDLFYRLNVVPINIPPLRERRDDISELALPFLDKLNRTRGEEKRLAPEVLDALQDYAFPGNVRELFNIIERMAVLSEGRVMTLADLPGEVRRPPAQPDQVLLGQSTIKDAVQSLEIRLIEAALGRHGSMGEAAVSLGIHPTTLWRKMCKYGMDSKLHSRNKTASLQ